MDVWEVPNSSCPGLDSGPLMDVGPTRSIVPRTRVVTMLACGVLLERCINAILIKELIELLVERMAGRWRELFDGGEKRFWSRLAFGQSHAESSRANVARENAPGGAYFNGLLTPRIR